MDSPKDAIGIANMALGQLGIDPISSFEGRGKNAQIAKEFFQIAKEEILREFVYDWAHKSEKLIPYSDDLGGYVQPADYINLIGLGTCDCFCCCVSTYKNLNSFSHRVSVRKINGRLFIESCCVYEYIHYSFNNLNYASMPSDLLISFVFRYAYLMCFPLTGNSALKTSLLQESELQTGKARKHAGLENRKTSREQRIRYPFGTW